jgi:hypothetical protein
MPYSIPFYAYTTSRFDELRSNGTRHRGHDVAPGGQDFPSWVNGTVVTAGWNSCLGNRVVVRNADDGYYVSVSHLANIKVAVGATVYIGTPLGNIGATGSCQNGRHAHIVVSPSSPKPEEGAVIDPVAYANNAAGGGGTNWGLGYGLTYEAQMSLQRAMSHVGRYTGPHDGAFGTISVRAMQQWLVDLGYLPFEYPIDGVPGVSYGKALQELGTDKGGYTGPIDGVLGAKSSAALVHWAEVVVIQNGGGASTAYAYGLNMEAQRQIQAALKQMLYYDGVVDGVFGPRAVSAMQQYLKHNLYLPDNYSADGKPGVKYGVAMQELASKYGYDGAFDGVLGDQTSTALILWAEDVLDGDPPRPPEPAPEVRWPDYGSFGIDIASTQRDIDLVKAKAEGAQFAIIKMGGLNITPQYVAPYYANQVDRARAAGLKVGHYYVIGLGQTPEEQARFFVANLHDFRPSEDILALDNERLDDNGTLWGDAECIRFHREVYRLTGVGVGWARWNYAGGWDYRALKPWTELEASDTVIWWAAYGANDGTRDHEPLIEDAVREVHVHQFSSVVDLAGYKLDGNWSPMPIEQLFGVWPVDGTEPPPPEPEPDYELIKAQITHALADLSAAMREFGSS